MYTLSKLYRALVLFTTCLIIWNTRWEKGVRYFDQKWSLLKLLQISHRILFRHVKQCPRRFFDWRLLHFRDIIYAKNLILLSHQHGTAKMLTLHYRVPLHMLSWSNCKKQTFVWVNVQFFIIFFSTYIPGRTNLCCNNFFNFLQVGFLSVKIQQQVALGIC